MFRWIGTVPLAVAIGAFTVVCGSGAVEATSRALAGYAVLVVDPVVVKQGPSTKDFKPGWEVLLHKGMVRQLRKKTAFAEVLDRTTSPMIEQVSAGSKRALLTSTVVRYGKGSRVVRGLMSGGWASALGAGAATTRMEFVITDFETGAELLRFERQGRFAGFLNSDGGTTEEALIESAGDVVDRLVEELRKNR